MHTVGQAMVKENVQLVPAVYELVPAVYESAAGHHAAPLAHVRSAARAAVRAGST